MGSSYIAIKPFPAAKAVDVSGIVIPVGWLVVLMYVHGIHSVIVSKNYYCASQRRTLE